MDRRRLLQLLGEVARGQVTPEQAGERLGELPYADLGFAKLDLQRELRNGQPEAVYGEGKRLDDLLEIVDRLVASCGRALVTRVAETPAAALRARWPEGRYHDRARVFAIGRRTPEGGAQPLVVLAAGTSDLPVAEEAAVCAEWLGHQVERVWDVGLAGVQRLFDRLDSIRRARVIVAVAGMDGALPTLVAGLVPGPVIAVPTSVGYGAAFGGLAPLLTMLNACAPGVAVVNIDNGYGAAALASRMLEVAQQSEAARSSSDASP